LYAKPNCKIIISIRLDLPKGHPNLAADHPFAVEQDSHTRTQQLLEKFVEGQEVVVQEVAVEEHNHEVQIAGLSVCVALVVVLIGCNSARKLSG
jgi:hypothetical protein